MSRSDFSEKWLASQFCVYFTGEVSAAFVATNFDDLLSIVERETTWTVTEEDSWPTDSWNPYLKNDWGNDDANEPFYFNIDVGEMSSMTIVRITG